MISSPCVLESAFVLHSRPYQNTSLLVDLLTKQHGRIAVIARSARGLKSRYRGRLELFTPILASWRGKHELKSLGTVDFVDTAPIILLEGERLSCGFYLNELLFRLLHRDDPHPTLFEEYQCALERLAGDACIHMTLRRFEKVLLTKLGYALPLCEEAQTRFPIESHAFYEYYPETGFKRVQPFRKKRHRPTFSGKSLIALRNDQFEDVEILKELKELLQISLQFYLNYKPIRSRELFQSLSD